MTIRYLRRDLGWARLWALATGGFLGSAALSVAWGAPAVSAILGLATARAWFRTASRTVDVRIEAERRVTVDGTAIDLADADSVAVEPRRFGSHEVVVRDARGTALWRLPGLRETHARCLALDLASTWGLSASPDPGRLPEIVVSSGPRTRFRTDLHGVRIGTGSGSDPGLPKLFDLLVVLAACLAAGTLGLPAAMLLLGLILPVVALAPPGYFSCVELALGPGALVVRAGWPFANERSIPVAALHPPRIVPGGPHGASLILRSDTGWFCEIRHRPPGELERIAFWIEHARSGGSGGEGPARAGAGPAAGARADPRAGPELAGQPALDEQDHPADRTRRVRQHSEPGVEPR